MMESCQKCQYNLARDKPDSRDITVSFLDTHTMLSKRRSYAQLPPPKQLNYQTRTYSLVVDVEYIPKISTIKT